jgi:hypothetical protein
MLNPKLSDTQLVILYAAAQRDGRTLLPVPKSVTAKGGALTSSLKSIRDRGLADEIDGVPSEQAWRSDDGRGIGLVISEDGLRAIGLSEKEEAGAEPELSPLTPVNANGAVEAPRDGTKGAKLVSLLSGQKGATIDTLVKKLGWQPHTVRAAMTGLRERGYTIERDKRADGTTVYRIPGEASQ